MIKFSLFDGIILILILVSLIVSIVAAYKYWKLERQLKVLFTGENSEDLRDKIILCLDRVNKVDGTNDILLERIKKLKLDIDVSIKKKALIRYNPFDREGGDQSFSLCLLDSKNDGVIVSSLYNRGSTNVYAKEIMKGEPKSVLSDEENNVLEEAIKYSN